MFGCLLLYFLIILHIIKRIWLFENSWKLVQLNLEFMFRKINCLISVTSNWTQKFFKLIKICTPKMKNWNFRKVLAQLWRREATFSYLLSLKYLLDGYSFSSEHIHCTDIRTVSSFKDQEIIKENFGVVTSTLMWADACNVMNSSGYGVSYKYAN